MKNLVKYGVVLTACALTLSGCNCFKKMAANHQTINIVANPEMLTLVGGKVTTEVTVTFPEKYYNSKAIAKITPVLKFRGDYEGQQVEDTPKFLQGEKVQDNYTVISTKNGGMYTQTVSFPWDPRAKQSALEFKLEGKCKEAEEFQFGGFIPVANGTNTLQQDLAYDEAMTIMPDNFQRVTHESAFVDLMYQKNQSNVRQSELSKEQVKNFQDFIKKNEGKDRTTLGNIQAKGYASPEGPESHNDKLSKQRGASAKTAVSKTLKGSKATYDVASYGEDWEGFKSIVEASDMKDKDLVLQVLNMYSSSAQRDSEIRNMSAVFQELQKEILPQLRRTQVSVTTDIQGKSDDEIEAAVAADLKTLDVEEMLFAATLFDDNDVKIEIYQAAADQYNDPRAWNNLAVAYAAKQDWANAESAIEKASALTSDAAIVNNLAVIALAMGNMDKANEFMPAAGKQAKALAAVNEGKYAQAASQLNGYNKAVAEVLNGNLTAAKKALAGNDNANADYLRAIIAVKEGNNDAALTALQSAVAKDDSYKAKAQSDMNIGAVADQL